MRNTKTSETATTDSFWLPTEELFNGCIAGLDAFQGSHNRAWLDTSPNFDIGAPGTWFGPGMLAHTLIIEEV